MAIPTRAPRITDGLRLGSLLGWHQAWKDNKWFTGTVHNGPCWTWICPPRLCQHVLQNSLPSHGLLLEVSDQWVMKPATRKLSLPRVLSFQNKTPQCPDLLETFQLNSFTELFMFRMLTDALVQLALRSSTWSIILDLEKAYWYILTDPRFQHFLAAQIRQTFLQLTVHLFNLKTAPWVSSLRL